MMLSLVLQWLGFGFGWPLLPRLTYRDQTLGLRSVVPQLPALNIGEPEVRSLYSFLLT